MAKHECEGVPIEFLHTATICLVGLDGPRYCGDGFNEFLQHLAAAREVWIKLPGPHTPTTIAAGDNDQLPTPS